MMGAHPIPVTLRDARCPSTFQVSGRTASGKNSPELLTMPSSAKGRIAATTLPVFASVKLPLNEDRQHWRDTTRRHDSPADAEMDASAKRPSGVEARGDSELPHKERHKLGRRERALPGHH